MINMQMCSRDSVSSAGTRKEEQAEMLPQELRTAGPLHSPLCKAGTHGVNGREWRSDVRSFP